MLLLVMRGIPRRRREPTCAGSSRPCSSRKRSQKDEFKKIASKVWDKIAKVFHEKKKPLTDEQMEKIDKLITHYAKPVH